MNRADVRKSQDEAIERPDVEAIERLASKGAGVGYIPDLIAWIRHLESRQ